MLSKMKAMTRLTRRTALLTAAVAIAMLVVASPAAAHAKTTTRIVVAGRTVDNSVDGASVWPVQLPAKVQKLTAGKWVTVSGTIRISRYNLTTQKYDFISSKSGKGVSFTITRRGKFRLQFLTTGALKAATNYATLREDIGLTIIAPQPGDFDISGSGGTSLVTATYVVHWNTAASVPPVTMAYEGYFSPFQGADASWTDGVWVYQERNI